MPLMTRRDEVFWLKHLRAAGIDIAVGETACFTINGAEIHVEPMRPDRNGRPTHRLKAIPFSLPRWNAIPKGAQMTIVPCANPSATFDERLGVAPSPTATETAVTAIASWPRRSLTLDRRYPPVVRYAESMWAIARSPRPLDSACSVGMNDLSPRRQPEPTTNTEGKGSEALP